MKTIIRNSRLIAIAVITLFFSNPVPAAVKDSSGINPRVELKFLNNSDNHSVFQLSVAGDPRQHAYSIIIRDLYGNSIYWEDVREFNFSKKFLFDTEELGDDTLEMEVYNRKTKTSVIYEINRNYKNTGDLVISKL